MNFKNIFFKLAIILVTGLSFQVNAQGIKWAKDGNSYYEIINGEVVSIALPSSDRKVIVGRDMIFGSGASGIISLKDFQISEDGSKVLLYANSKKVWRYETRGDYYVADLKTNQVQQIGKGKPASSLMFAKFSPDGLKVAYVSGHNLYVDDLASGSSKALTSDGTDRLINGTFDWVYEEEFDCRDGFRWSPDGKSIAYWQIDATRIRNFLMINNTDSIYSYTIPVEYPKVGQNPSSCKVGVVDITSAKTNWLAVPGDQVQHYIPRMDWIPNSTEVILQQLNRQQNQSKIFIASAQTGAVTNIYTETDKAWIDANKNWEWINEGKEFLWSSEKDGWRHVYRISRDGKKQTLVTTGNYDVIEQKLVDEKNGLLYFMASPTNATQLYLFKTKLSGGVKPEQVSPLVLPGTHSYDIAPNAVFARHTYQTAAVNPITEWMRLTTMNPLTMEGSVTNQLGRTRPP